MIIPEISPNILCVPSRDSRADSIGDTLDNAVDCLALVLHALRDDAEALEFGRVGLSILLDIVIDALHFAKNVATQNEFAAGEVVVALNKNDSEKLRKCAAGGPVDELAASIIADALRKLQVTN
ncbi:MAG: hypothetical protein P9E88_18075 [Candidatus Competibacter sp.]|nr:hypothetical protein [Candidatus Competibacter sp.]